MDYATEQHAFEHPALPLEHDDFVDTQEHGKSSNDDALVPAKPENADQAEWPDFSDEDPDEFFAAEDFEEDFTVDLIDTEDFDPDVVLSAGWESDDGGKQPAWRELERRREQMELERALHDELFDF